MQTATLASPELIIGLGHRKRVGKDTFAGFLETALERRGYRAYRLAFALPMKEQAYHLFRMYGLRDAAYYEAHPQERHRTLPRIHKSPRQIWIEYGNAVRAVCSETWVRQLEEQMEDIRFALNEKERPYPLAFIISDVRFHNEADAVKCWGGKLIKVTRAAAPRGDDPAECSLDDYKRWNMVVSNDGGLGDLKASACRIAKFLTSPKKG